MSGLNQNVAAEKRRKKNPSRQTRAFFQEQHPQKRHASFRRLCVYCGCSCGFFQPEKMQIRMERLKNDLTRILRGAL
nr:MAG TPA: hypothetical protein [Caudoviricetes sp.]